jgi:hypothetical protein
MVRSRVLPDDVTATKAGRVGTPPPTFPDNNTVRAAGWCRTRRPDGSSIPHETQPLSLLFASPGNTDFVTRRNAGLLDTPNPLRPPVSHWTPPDPLEAHRRGRADG